VVDFATVIFGYLAAPECRRAIARGWLIVVRGLLGSGLALIALFLVWFWWLSAGLDPSFVPAGVVQIALATAAMILLTIDVVMVPAVLAGSLAGERERGVLQLLLTTSATPREIVLGRLAGKLSQVGMIVLAGVPVVAFLGAWSGFRMVQFATFLLLLLSVGAGGGGLAVLASVISRRGRDALLSVYLLILVLYLSPLLERFGLPSEAAAWLTAFSPYVSLGLSIQYGQVAPSLLTSGCWFLIGLASAAAAAWRLRPSCVPGAERARKGRRARHVPPIDENRPLLWKELYIERVGTLGRFGRWLGWLITVGFGGVSLALAAVIAWSLFVRHDTSTSDWAISQLSGLLDDSRVIVGWLLQWAVGLRAAVSIASERERGTWDALLVTALEPGEIVGAKVIGSLNALRWMAGSLILAWTLGLVTGAVTPADYATWLFGNLTACTLMAAVGVRSSLGTSTSARAMTWSIAWWLMLVCGVALLTVTILLLGFTICIAVWLYMMAQGWVLLGGVPWFPLSWNVAWHVTTNAINLLITITLVLDTRLRFDRLAGRNAGGAVAAKVDDWLHGHAREAVFVPTGNGAPSKAVETSAKAIELGAAGSEVGPQ
jgi:ABC-type transport system involved in multi-copper enzyme maturation permease subunit